MNEQVYALTGIGTTAIGGIVSSDRPQYDDSMLCQKCGLTTATVHRSFTVFRQKIDEHLCQPCAGVGCHVVPFPPPTLRFDPVPAADVEWSLNVPRDRYRPKAIVVPSGITVRDLCVRLRIKPFLGVAILMRHGTFATLNQPLDYEAVEQLCRHCRVKPVQAKT